ncbi:hypothetical protein ACWGNU_09610 [Paenibacillus lautus]
MKISIKLTPRYICRSQFLGASPNARNAIQSLDATNANIDLSSVLANKKKDRRVIPGGKYIGGRNFIVQ